MRIAIWYNLHSGGGKRALFNHVRGLIEAGHYVEAWTPTTRDPEFAPLDSLIPLHVRPLGLSDKPSLANKLGLTRRAKAVSRAMNAHCRLVAKEIHAGGYDILFANSCYHVASSPIGRFVDLPSVLYLQEPRRQLYETGETPLVAALEPWRPGMSPVSLLRRAAHQRRRLGNARILVREEVRSARAFGRVLCNSYFSRESIMRAYGIDAEVCYLSIDLDKFRYSEAVRADHVVGLGIFGSHKNPRICIEAIGTMPEPRPKLIWIGNGGEPDYINEMIALAERLGVRFELHLNASDEQLVRTLSSAFAMIYASRLEPFGLAPLEANACGTPVVAVAEGGVRETVVDDENGFLVDASAPALGEALQRLMNNPALARRLGSQGRILVERRWTAEAANACLIGKLEEELGKT